MLQVKNLTVAYGAHTVVNNLSFGLPPGQWLMVVGPNGAGKSTLINALSQGVRYTGQVLLNGVNAADLRPARLARKMGVLAQSHFVNYAFTVEDVVRLGRYAYAPGPFSGPQDEDRQKIEEALAQTGMAGLRKQSVLTLSGGELQRCFLAQLLAQDPELLILDEPANHLDLQYQKQVFELVQAWVARTGRSVLSVVHDLSLARAYGAQALLMHHGEAVAFGSASDVLTRENLSAVYALDVFDWMRSLLAQWH